MTMSKKIKHQLLQLLYSAIDEINQEQPLSARLTKTPQTVLYGEGGTLDSLGLVRLVVLFERKVSLTTGHTISITDERAFSQRRSPFRTASTLAEYVAQLLSET